MRLERRVISVFLLVRPRGSVEPYRRQEFRSRATSRQHAEQLARQCAEIEKNYEVSQPH